MRPVCTQKLEIRQSESTDNWGKDEQQCIINMKKINFQKKFQMNSMSNCVKRHLETRKKKKDKIS